MGRPCSEAWNAIEIDHIEAYLKRTGSYASRLSTAATGTGNHISRMRNGEVVAVKHRKAILRYIDEHPEGPPKAVRKKGRQVGDRFPEGYSMKLIPRKERTSIPVPGPSQLEPDLFHSIKAEAFKRGKTVVHFMEEIMRLGWQHYCSPVLEKSA